jgi:hypothetical protein
MRPKRIIPAALIIPVCFLVYQIGKGIYHSGVKDGKGNAPQHTVLTKAAK